MPKKGVRPGSDPENQLSGIRAPRTDGISNESDVQLRYAATGLWGVGVGRVVVQLAQETFEFFRKLVTGGEGFVLAGLVG